MSYYESVFITRQELADKDIQRVITDFTSILKQNKASVLNTEMWGLRNLAYKIEKNKKGHYVMLQIEGDGKAIKELERNMRINEDIIRFLSLKIDHISKTPSIMMKKNFETTSEESRVYSKSTEKKIDKRDSKTSQESDTIKDSKKDAPITKKPEKTTKTANKKTSVADDTKKTKSVKKDNKGTKSE